MNPPPVRSQELTARIEGSSDADCALLRSGAVPPGFSPANQKLTALCYETVRYRISGLNMFIRQMVRLVESHCDDYGVLRSVWDKFDGERHLLTALLSNMRTAGVRMQFTNQGRTDVPMVCTMSMDWFLDYMHKRLPAKAKSRITEGDPRPSCASRLF